MAEERNEPACATRGAHRSPLWLIVVGLGWGRNWLGIGVMGRRGFHNTTMKTKLGGEGWRVLKRREIQLGGSKLFCGGTGGGGASEQEEKT